jgi:methionine-rich copper-binding protein CopC
MANHLPSFSRSGGRDTVMWSVLAVDGHRTGGDYTFTLKGPE